MATYRALPYGISDFRRIRRENYYLVDKSSFITKLEETIIMTLQRRIIFRNCLKGFG